MEVGERQRSVAAFEFSDKASDKVAAQTDGASCQSKDPPASSGDLGQCEGARLDSAEDMGVLGWTLGMECSAALSRFGIPTSLHFHALCSAPVLAQMLATLKATCLLLTDVVPPICSMFEAGPVPSCPSLSDRCSVIWP